MTAIIVLLMIFASMALGAASVAVHLWHESKNDNEYWELFHEKNDDWTKNDG